MSDNKHTISVSTIEPSENRQQDPVMDPVHLAQVPANADSQLVREYRGAFLLIHKVREQMKGLTVDGNLIETMVDGEAEEPQSPIRRKEPHLIEEQLLATPIDPPMAGPVPLSMTFTELAQRFSEQMEEVVATGKQITAASRQMASGVNNLNEGLEKLQRKLSRVKY